MKYGFIGCGNMGGAIAQALSRGTTDILLASGSGTTAQALAHKLGCGWAQTNGQIVEQCSYVFLAVKPQMMESVLVPLRPLLQRHRPVLISMAAGVTIAQLEALAATGCPILRIMPNTPVAVGKGLVTYCANALLKDADLQTILSDLSHAGTFDSIPEKLMDAASAAAGCSPAYAYMFIEAMADGAVACGLPRAKAIRYAAAALAGAAEMVLSIGEHPGALKDAVCSPGGSTIAGVRVLEEQGFRGAVMDCIIAAWERNQQLGK